MTASFVHLLFLLFATVNFVTSNSVGVGDKSASTRIVNGTAAALGEFPAQISLQRRTRSHFCGGILLDATHVLTAAHCVTDKDTLVVDDPSSYYIMGESLTVRPITNLSNQTRDATHIFVHTLYNSTTMQNDVAVIRVSPAFTFSRTINVAIRADTTPTTNTSCAVAGWGTTSTNGSPSSILLRVNVSITDRIQCNQAYGGITTGMICAGTPEGDKDSCQGDSGGGLYCGSRVAGIVSFGANCADAKYPGVYTNIASYNDWINWALNWNGGSHSNIPTPPTARPSGGSSSLTSFYSTIIFSILFVMVSTTKYV